MNFLGHVLMEARFGCGQAEFIKAPGGELARQDFVCLWKGNVS